MGDAIGHMPEISACRHAIHGSVHRRRSHRCRRQAEQIAVAFGDQLRGQLRYAVQPPRHHIAVLRQRLAGTIGPMMLVHRTGTDVDESLQPGHGARPIEHGHRAHDIDVDDAAGILRFRFAFSLGRCAARQRRDRGAVHDVRDALAGERRRARPRGGLRPPPPRRAAPPPGRSSVARPRPAPRHPAPPAVRSGAASSQCRAEHAHDEARRAGDQQGHVSGKFNSSPSRACVADAEIVQCHCFIRIVAAMIVAHEDHTRRNAHFCKYRGIVAGAARHFVRMRQETA